MRKQLAAYLLMEQVMMAADDADDDFGHEVRDKYMDALWHDLTEDEHEALNNRAIRQCYAGLVGVLRGKPVLDLVVVETKDGAITEIPGDQFLQRIPTVAKAPKPQGLREFFRRLFGIGNDLR